MERRMVESSLSASTVARARTAITIIAPLAMLAAFAYHPHIMFLPSPDAVSHAVQADTNRWAIAHWGLGMASGLMALAFLAVRGWLSDAGENRLSAMALPFLIFSASVYAILPGMEFTVFAAARTGADIVASQQAVDSWFVPTMLIAGLSNALGAILLATAVRRSRVLGAVRPVVVAALYVVAVSRLVPIGPVQFYVQGTAFIVALWPIALDIRRQTSVRGISGARAIATG